MREPEQFIKEYDNDDADDVFLRLQRLTSEEIVLDHTTKRGCGYLGPKF